MNLKNISLIAILVITGIGSNFAQSKAKPQISLIWKIAELNYNQSGQTRSELALVNNGTTPFPSSGWEIYFNSPPPKLLDQASTHFTITHINGDFFKLSPGKSFERIVAGEKSTLDLLTRTLRNITDYPKGFYIVYENTPSEPVSLPITTVPAADFRTQERALANLTFQKNAKISNQTPDSLSPILPTPDSFKYLRGSFNLTPKVKIVSPSIFKNEADYLSNQMKTVLGVKPGAGVDGNKDVIILQENKNLPTEGYELTILPSQILIKAADNAGIFYGIQSLKNLLPASAWKNPSSLVQLKAITIKDAPRFSHRAFMMEIARNYLPKEQIIKTLDVLSLYKMNVMHLHFNDDEGWRIEIEGLPELTETGSKRGHTLTELDHLIPSYGSGPFISNTSGSGYLKREEFIEILKYAKERHITIIPEYETPGHARAAIKAMDARYHRLISEGKPEEARKYLLRDFDDKSSYESVQGFTDNIINPALPSVYNFIEKITDETIAMYKEAGALLKTIHFGGDEVPAGVWEKSPIVHALLKKDTTIKNIDELWQYYFSKVDAILKARNLYLSGWEEIGLMKSVVDGKKQMVLDRRFANKNYHVDVWNNLSGNEDLAYKLANAGYKVVLSNVTNMYLDLAYTKSYFEPGQYWGGFVDIDKPFQFIPLDYNKNQNEDKFGEPLPKDYYKNKDTLTTFGATNVIGLQAPLWSEIITSKEIFEYLLMPKLLGVAERCWASDPAWATEPNQSRSELLYHKAWSDFINSVGKKELEKLDFYAGGFQYRIPPAGFTVTDGKIKANVLYPGLIIRYTTDGTEPDTKSKVFIDDLSYQENIKLKVFNKQGRSGTTVTVIK